MRRYFPVRDNFCILYGLILLSIVFNGYTNVSAANRIKYLDERIQILESIHK